MKKTAAKKPDAKKATKAKVGKDGKPKKKATVKVARTTAHAKLAAKAKAKTAAGKTKALKVQKGTAKAKAVAILKAKKVKTKVRSRMLSYFVLVVWFTFVLALDQWGRPKSACVLLGSNKPPRVTYNKPGNRTMSSNDDFLEGISLKSK